MSHRHVFFLTTDRSRAGGSQPMLTTTLCRLLRRQASGRGCWRKTSCDAGLADAAGFGISQARVSGPSAWMRLPSIHACQTEAPRFPLSAKRTLPTRLLCRKYSVQQPCRALALFRLPELGHVSTNRLDLFSVRSDPSCSIVAS
jgi:hypothetical protein